MLRLNTISVYSTIFTEYTCCPASRHLHQTLPIRPQYIIGFSLLGAAVLTLLTPVVADELGYGALMAVRILIGVCQASQQPLGLGFRIGDCRETRDRRLSGESKTML